MRPDFLVIGAQKAGTTWLYEQLRAHPDIWLPKEKELHYFDERAVLGHDRLRDRIRGKREHNVRWRRQLRRQVRSYRRERSLAALRWDARYFFGTPSDDWYASLFARAGARVSGEVTPKYAILDEAGVDHVRRVTPNARILFLMRNPIERAWSHAAMELRRRQGLEPPSVDDFRAHFRSEGNLRRTDYETTIDRWTSRFGNERVFVGFLEDIRFHPRDLLASVHSFLGVDDCDPPTRLDQPIHAGRSTSLPALLAADLAELHAPHLERLADRFGGYADWWVECAAALRKSTDDGELSYPFTETPLFADWLASRSLHSPQVQSAALPSLGAAEPPFVSDARNGRGDSAPVIERNHPCTNGSDRGSEPRPNA
jgi:hypothetical protein